MSPRDKVLGTNTNTGSSILRLFEYIQVQEVSQTELGQMSVQCFVGRMLVFISGKHLPKGRQPNRELC